MEFSLCNLMEKFKTAQRFKSRSCEVGSKFPAGVGDPKSCCDKTGNFKF